MLHYDSFFTIGKTHTICEDYAIQGDTPYPFLIVCDGCSSSAHSDVGARVLSLVAKALIETQLDNLIDNYQLFGQRLIHNAAAIVHKLAMPLSVLDATTLIALQLAQKIRVYVYGDGVILLKDRQGNVNYIEIEFTHNAPYYLSYWLTPTRQQEYASHDSHPLIINDSRAPQKAIVPYNKQLIFDFSLTDYQTVAIASDGIGQCYNFADGIRISVADIAEQLLAFKQIEGDFVKRRVKRALEQLAKQGVYAADDLTLAAFVDAT
ncbi:protein phosphatase 2C domain-containing protein [Beggiatoa leptomitoformis]|uniref:PPM-type phosphatase domain-containing protein n=1 Tax=Beggiatoa leptomitoformis TaxID=288004 RepID=A0A2N9YCF6_9GAMM|nr:protein phosphatase 2C domain-containing protein [Beggiatoa leptomitoformis]ALG66550.1 hypothetical protein AL038_00855 [Beggiatoa leptomitoformis]AUI68151.1 hypothetical protein BLE401_05190 [Beggiatoa leptomitoformis]